MDAERMRRTGSKHCRENAADLWTPWDGARAASLISPPLGPSTSASYGFQASADTVHTYSTRFNKVRKLEPLAEWMIDEEVEHYLQMARQQRRLRAEEGRSARVVMRGSDAQMPHACDVCDVIDERQLCSASPPPPSSTLLFTAHASATLTGADEPTPWRQSVHEDDSATDSVDLALNETFRVLRTCWTFAGHPQDAFEPARHLSPMTRHLLLTYGRHRLTADGQYVVLDGGEEQMPYVGVLLDCVARQLQRHCGNDPRTPLGNPIRCARPSTTFASFAVNEEQEGSVVMPVREPSTRADSHDTVYDVSPFRFSYHTPRPAATTEPYVTETTQTHTTFAHSMEWSARDGRRTDVPAILATSRLVMLNCRAVNNADRHASTDDDGDDQVFHRVNDTLRGLVMDTAYTHVGHPSVESHSTPPWAPQSVARTRRVSDLAAQTVVLLADAELMDGGVLSLDVARHGASVFVAHHQHGRGVACLLPSLPRVHHCQHRVVRSHTAGLPTSDEKDRGAHRADDLRLFPHALPTSLPPVEAASPLTRSPLSMPPIPAPPLSNTWWDRFELPPLSCGTRSVADAATAQAVLLSPVGPLLLHVQFQLDGPSGELARLFESAQPPPPSPAAPHSPLWRDDAVGSCRDRGDAARYAVRDVSSTPFDARVRHPQQDGGTWCDLAASSAFLSSHTNNRDRTQPNAPVVNVRSTPTATATSVLMETDEKGLEPTQTACQTQDPCAARCSLLATGPSATFSITDLPYVLYLAASGEALTPRDVSAAAAAPYVAGTATQAPQSETMPFVSSSPLSGWSDGEHAWPRSRALTLTAQLVELAEWALRLLRSPVPIVLAEWQLGCSASSVRERASGTVPSFGMTDGAPRPSLVIALLEAYVEGLAARSERQAASSKSHTVFPFSNFTASSLHPYHDEAAFSPPMSRTGCDDHTDEMRSPRQDPLIGYAGSRSASSPFNAPEDVHALRGAVRHIIQGLVRCPDAALFDGQERPILFTRGLDLAAETERFATATTVLTSMQYRRDASTA